MTPNWLHDILDAMKRDWPVVAVFGVAFVVMVVMILVGYLTGGGG